MREKHTIDEGVQSINMDESEEACGPYENQSPQKRKVPMMDVNIAASITHRSNERMEGDESSDGRIIKHIIFSNAVGFSPKSNLNIGGTKIMNASSSNGSLLDHNNAREVILSQLQHHT
jgi:hypothetical protein